ncbi:MAG: hypothetical protein OXK80_06360 [Bdellovibrionales bacterium]|nr:hypothetical protein [Bdellovibrionales bacterium]
MFNNLGVYVRQIMALTKKDFFQIISSPMFFIILGVSCFFWSFVYVRSLIVFASESMAMPVQMAQEGGMNIHYYVFFPLLAQVNLLLLFIVPALTMRLFSEERKLQTFDLLMSSPLTSAQIVIGKFCSAYKCSFIIISVSFIYILITSLFADFNWTMPFLSYLGLLLLTAVYVSLGVLASALSSSLVLSTILGVVFNVFIWIITNQIKDISSNPIFSELVEYLNIPMHFEQFVMGKFVISSFCFFIIIVTFLIFLTVKVIDILRWR